MAVDRKAAKAGIKNASEAQDPELTDALRSAGDLRVALEKEGNRHKEKMAAKELGWLGHPLGGRESAPVNIAFVVMLLGLIFWWWCLGKAQPDGADQQYWADNANRVLALATTALGYIFGQKTSK
ncbi:hypothetical protein D1820_10300 [Phaeobacter sp. LSS9]|uniref:hypothetical protein n=1 Tax=unclassified Phaeobacter TaxID=2621772 RepID=UPI000E53947F|nr:hypothetical protein [Phaeobacter sp. LSS9]AXT35338.1 hypothetical protein D1820_10300 [Phaeobacter sp. LSS9]